MTDVSLCTSLFVYKALNSFFSVVDLGFEVDSKCEHLIIIIGRPGPEQRRVVSIWGGRSSTNQGGLTSTSTFQQKRFVYIFSMFVPTSGSVSTGCITIIYALFCDLFLHIVRGYTKYTFLNFFCIPFK